MSIVKFGKGEKRVKQGQSPCSHHQKCFLCCVLDVQFWRTVKYNNRIVAKTKSQTHLCLAVITFFCFVVESSALSKLSGRSSAQKSEASCEYRI